MLDSSASPRSPRPDAARPVTAPRRRRSIRARRSIAAAIAVPLLLVAAACSDDDSPSVSSATTAADGSTASTVVNTSSLDDVEISTDLAVEPTVTFDPSFAASEPQDRMIVEGDGAPVNAGDWVSVNYVVVSGADGSQVASTWTTRPETLPIDDSLQDAFRDVIIDTPLGSRVAVANQSEEGWVILVIDLESLVPKTASGTDVAPVDGLPTVAVVEGTPTVTVPATDPPTELIVQPLIQGTGPVVETGQTITVQYVGLTWASGTVFDSSWSRGAPVAFSIGTGEVIPGWDQGLVGQNVGSRVLLMIPPELGYGAEGNPNAKITGTDTLVFVVDILAAG